MLRSFFALAFQRSVIFGLVENDQADVVVAESGNDALRQFFQVAIGGYQGKKLVAISMLDYLFELPILPFAAGTAHTSVIDNQMGTAAVSLEYFIEVVERVFTHTAFEYPHDVCHCYNPAKDSALQ